MLHPADHLDRLPLSLAGGRSLSALLAMVAWWLVTAGMPAMSASAELQQPLVKFGTVWRLRGDVSAESDSASVRRLRLGDPVYVGETIRTPSAGEAVLRTEDAGLLALRPGASFSIEQFAANGSAADSFGIRLLTGSLRIISGWIGRKIPSNYRITTPAATIGIRGTDHEPYVMPSSLAQRFNQREGTYDKVNRGGTTLETRGGSVDIAPGQVGFAPSRPNLRERGLFTILLPSILDAVPDFFVPGTFDVELDSLSSDTEEESVLAYEVRRKTLGLKAELDSPTTESAGVDSPSEESIATQTAEVSSQERHDSSSVEGPACNAQDIARAWLTRFDAAVMDRQPKTIAALFAPDVVVLAYVRKSDGSFTAIEMERDTLVQSTIAALENLRDYEQRRITVEARITQRSAGTCSQVEVRSAVIEQGKQGNLPYRMEAIEHYVLELREGTWFAIRASTTQE